jgi:hypothetical protein
MPGTATVPAPISYGIRCPTKITSISVPGPDACRPSPGTLTKKSDAADPARHRVVHRREPAPADPVKIVSAAAADQHHGDGGVHGVAAALQDLAPASAVVVWPAATPARVTDVIRAS